MKLKLDPYKNKLRHLFEEGKSYNEIIAILKKDDVEVSKSTLARYKKKHFPDLYQSKRSMPLKAEICKYSDEIANLIIAGVSDSQIARIISEDYGFKISRKAIASFRKDKVNLEEKISKEVLGDVESQSQIIDEIVNNQLVEIKTGLHYVDNIIHMASNLQVDFKELEEEVRFSDSKSKYRYLIDIANLKIKYMEIGLKAFEAKNRLFADEMQRMLDKHALEIEEQKVENNKVDLMDEIEILAKQFDEKSVEADFNIVGGK